MIVSYKMTMLTLDVQLWGIGNVHFVIDVDILLLFFLILFNYRC